MKPHSIRNSSSALRKRSAAWLAAALIASALVAGPLANRPLLAQDHPAVQGDRASVYKVPPTYPPLARQMHISGIIRVIATVGPTGTVLTAESTEGNKLLTAAAVEAVKQWRFVPAPRQSTVIVKVNFQ